MTGAQLWPGHVVQVRNDDVATVMAALVRRLRAAGWTGPDPALDEWGYNRRLKRWAEDKYRQQGLTAAQWLQVAALPEWSEHAWGTAVDLDTTANPMLTARPPDPQAHTTFPWAGCPGIAASLGLTWGGAWDSPWDPQHWQVAVTPQRLAQIAAPVRRSMEVLDYSSGYPAPSAIKTGGYAGVVRYIGTAGRGKNLTRAEAQAMLAAGVPIALVYEDSAGWMRGGAAAGTRAARAALADAADCDVTVRCVYFACDEDVTTQMGAVLGCLDGAAQVLGLGRVGVYGEADVIDAAVPGHATWGWQTRAWSGGRVSAKAALLQQIGYRTVGGVQCDGSTILQDDWGQWPLEGIDDMTDAQYEALDTKLDNMYRIMVFGDAPDSQLGPDGKPVDKGGHGNNLEAIRNDVRTMRAALTAQIAAQASAIAALSGLIGAGTNDLTAEQVQAAVEAAIAAALPAGGMTPEQQAALATAIAEQVDGLSDDVAEAALRRVFADAATPEPPA
jgi:hypothetical protein